MGKKYYNLSLSVLSNIWLFVQRGVCLAPGRRHPYFSLGNASGTLPDSFFCADTPRTLAPLGYRRRLWIMRGGRSGSICSGEAVRKRPGSIRSGEVGSSSVLRRCACLARCSDGFVAELERALDRRLYFTGEELYRQGEDDGALYILELGAVTMEVAGRPIRVEEVPRVRTRLCFSEGVNDRSPTRRQSVIEVEEEVDMERCPSPNLKDIKAIISPEPTHPPTIESTKFSNEFTSSKVCKTYDYVYL